MKINLKFKALSVLMSGLQDTQMWVIYQMASGNDLPDSITKMDLIKIIEFLFKHLDWIEGTNDSMVELESASNIDNQVKNGTQDSGNEYTKPDTSKSLISHQVKFLSGAENHASNAGELNEETENQHLRVETDADSRLDYVAREN